MKKEPVALNRVKSSISSVKGTALMTMASLGLLPSQIYAAVNVEPVNIGAAADDPDTIISNVLGIILLVARYIGMGLILWGLVMFGLAVKNDEPESKTKALMTTFAGVILFALKSILTSAGIVG